MLKTIFIEYINSSEHRNRKKKFNPLLRSVFKARRAKQNKTVSSFNDSFHVQAAVTEMFEVCGEEMYNVMRN